jgi:hypothetical protein
MNIIRINKFCTNITIVLLSFISAHSNELTIVKSGTAQAKIIIPAKTKLDNHDMPEADSRAFILNRFPNCSNEEKLALAELRGVVRKITGAGLKVVLFQYVQQ